MSQLLLSEKPSVSQISCLAINLGEMELLAPISAVAEIIPFRKPLPYQGADWVVGAVQWRKLQIPVVDFLKLDGVVQGTEQDDQAKLLIFNCMSNHRWFEYYAVVTRGFPQSRFIHSDQALEDAGAVSDFVRHSVVIDDRPYSLIDLEAVEARLEQDYFL